MEGNELLSTIQPLLFTQPPPTQVLLAWERGQGPRCIATAAIYQLKHGKVHVLHISQGTYLLPNLLPLLLVLLFISAIISWLNHKSFYLAKNHYYFSSKNCVNMFQIILSLSPLLHSFSLFFCKKSRLELIHFLNQSCLIKVSKSKSWHVSIK